MADTKAARMQRLLRLSLDQLAGTLQVADEARCDILIKGKNSLIRPETQQEHDAIASLEVLNEEYHEILVIALLLARLCASTEYQKSHRLARLIKLLQASEAAAHRYASGYNNVRTAIKAKGRLVRSVRQLKLARESLPLMWDAYQEAAASHQQTIGIEAYFNIAPYECHRGASELKHNENPLALDSTILEAYMKPVVTTAIDRTPRWPLETSRKSVVQYTSNQEKIAFSGSYAHVDQSEIDQSEIDQSEIDQSEIDQSIDLGAVNAIWHCLTESALCNENDKEAYLKLCLILEQEAGTTWRSGLNRQATWDTTTLTKGLTKISVDLGFIFGDDHTVVVWPSGKFNANRGRGIVLYCVQPLTTAPDDGLNYRYRPLVMEHAENDKQEAKPRLPASETNMALDLHPKTFMDLPAELRNIIYGFYLHNSSTEVKWDEVSRQFYEEVTPLWLAGKQFWCDLHNNRLQGKKITFMFDGNYSIRLLPSQAHIRRLAIPFGQHAEARTLYIDWTEQARGCGEVVVFEKNGRRALDRAGEPRYASALRKLIEILVEDNGTNGLSLIDAAVMADLLYIHHGWKSEGY
ncbi:hypothetical protein LTR56_013076 [Elasticomyces elasticus]|nr:hypothetical protein LTR56_013076 [Elasticomyces elasticus]KAK3640255.1 hypothetical protein LTR22_017090 [Elasticomyces elasticus]KAK4920532.1 hypothetical protein LTR49_011947 [Elasticomyces elasticus]KAK5758968.1 hypothetical protein LTS12_010909 [Elasticomyces elasticus]